VACWGSLLGAECPGMASARGRLADVSSLDVGDETRGLVGACPTGDVPPPHCVEIAVGSDSEGVVLATAERQATLQASVRKVNRLWGRRGAGAAGSSGLRFSHTDRDLDKALSESHLDAFDLGGGALAHGITVTELAMGIPAPRPRCAGH